MGKTIKNCFFFFTFFHLSKQHGATGNGDDRYSSDTASKFSLIMVSITTWNTTWMLEVSVAVVKWW